MTNRRLHIDREIMDEISTLLRLKMKWDQLHKDHIFYKDTEKQGRLHERGKNNMKLTEIHMSDVVDQIRATHNNVIRMANNRELFYRDLKNTVSSFGDLRTWDGLQELKFIEKYPERK